jgi:hypothetical protein
MKANTQLDVGIGRNVSFLYEWWRTVVCCNSRCSEATTFIDTSVGPLSDLPRRTRLASSPHTASQIHLSVVVTSSSLVVPTLVVAFVRSKVLQQMLAPASTSVPPVWMLSFLNVNNCQLLSKLTASLNDNCSTECVHWLPEPWGFSSVHCCE